MPFTAFTNGGSTVSSLAGVTVNTPVTAGNIATYYNTSGELSQNSNPAINVGNIQAGDSGNAGAFVSYPSGSNSGSLKVYASNNSANYTTSITNASQGQSSVITIPDPGASTASFILSNATSTQTILSTLQIQNSLQIGNSTTNGSITLYPGTANYGNSVLTTTGNSGNYTTTYNFNSYYSVSEMTVPDVDSSTGVLVVAAGSNPFTNTHLISVARTQGVVEDAGYGLQFQTYSGTSTNASFTIAISYPGTIANYQVTPISSSNNAYIQTALTNGSSTGIIMTYNTAPGTYKVNILIMYV